MIITNKQHEIISLYINEAYVHTDGPPVIPGKVVIRTTLNPPEASKGTFLIEYILKFGTFESDDNGKRILKTLYLECRSKDSMIFEAESLDKDYRDFTDYHQTIYQSVLDFLATKHRIKNATLQIHQNPSPMGDRENFELQMKSNGHIEYL